MIHVRPNQYHSITCSQFNLGPASQLPRARPAITLHRKSTNRRILNEDELVAALRTLGPVRVVEHVDSTPVAEQVRLAAKTSLLVGVHTSSLAIAPMLRPGSAVLELLQRNWRYEHLDESFKVRGA